MVTHVLLRCSESRRNNVSYPINRWLNLAAMHGKNQVNKMIQSKSSYLDEDFCCHSVCIEKQQINLIPSREVKILYQSMYI